MLKLLPLLLLLTAAPALAGEHLAGQVARVTDGDTFALSDKTRIRLWGIDAPEKRQSCDGADGKPYPCGLRAQQALEAMILGRRVDCEDRQPGGSYGRRVASCSVDGRDLGAWLVEQGYAVDYRRYSKGRYLPEQVRAEADHRGLWSGRFTPPEQWRREQRH